MGGLDLFRWTSFFYFVLFGVIAEHEPSANYACTTQKQFDFCKTSLEIDERVKSLIAMLTPEEKAGQLGARSSQAIPRLGIPLFCWGQNAIYDVSSSCGTGHCPTVFPLPPAMAATFNSSTVHNMAAVFATEARSLFNEGVTGGGYRCPGSVVTWGPTMNLDRDPRWGRNWETPSEDPFLNGMYASNFVKGGQNGEDERYLKLVVTIKHWVAYSVESFHGVTRHDFNANVSMYDFFDSYAPAFGMAVQSGVGGIMCSYNAMNGVPTCASQFLRSVLRDQWKFDGYVTSDTDAVADIFTSHHYTKSPAEAVRDALDAGTDIESTVRSVNYYNTLIPELLANGTIKQTAVDDALMNTFRLRFRLGLFDPIEGQPYVKIPISERRTNAHLDAALDAAHQSIVLLKNDGGVLPLSMGKKIVLIGPFAKSGNPNLLDIVEVMNAGGSVVYEEGCGVTDPSTKDFEKALAAAHNADVVLLAIGSSSTVEREAHDREYIDLPGVQSQLALQVIATGKPTAVLLFNRGSLSIDKLKEVAPAILVTFSPENTTGLGNVLFGDYNPGGKLPYTFYPKSYIANLSFFDMSMTAGQGRSYRYYTESPLYPFGYGLSYTTFQLSMESSPFAEVSGRLHQGSSLNFTVKVRNVGDRSGTEVVQLYFKPMFTRTTAPLPLRQLIDFQRVAVKPGAFEDVSFSVQFSQMSTVNEKGVRSTLPGDYQLLFTNGVDQTVTSNIHVPS